MTEIGERIKHYRLERLLTQHELADLAGVAVTYLQKIESGRETPPR